MTYKYSQLKKAILDMVSRQTADPMDSPDGYSHADLLKLLKESGEHLTIEKMQGKDMVIDDFLEMTKKLDQHPDGYDGPCSCQECISRD